jgi:transposase
MSKKIFSEKEIKLLSANPYVKAVSSKGITYADEFKRIFITENEKGKHQGKYLRMLDLI